MNHIAEYLPDYERLNGIRYGAAMELMDRGMTVGQFDSIVKQAQVRVPSLSLGDVFRTSLVFGIPLGTLAYVVSRSLKKGSRKSRKMRKELDYYNGVTSELKNRMGYAGQSDDKERGY
jgi:hypothetical protein